MSMIGYFYLVDDECVRSLLADPTSVHDVLDASEGAGEDRFVDVQKAWQALHFLLTGTAWGGDPPLNFILGGTAVGDEDVGYGPARVFFSSEVAAIVGALQPLERSQLLQRFDTRLMDELEIYPLYGNWSEEAITQKDFGDYLEAFDDIKRLLEHAQAEGLGLLVWMS